MRVYAPQAQVTLYKTIGRSQIVSGVPVSSRFQGSQRRIDLGPFLTENSDIRTTKGVSQPAGGFTINFGDRGSVDAMSGSIDSLYGLIEPMDMIEIRFAHGDGAAVGDKPPIVMRGFVSRVTRNEEIDAEGIRTGVVTVEGQDYGKIWQIMQIRYFNQYAIGEQYLSNFKLYEKFGDGFKTGQSAQDFLVETINKLLTPYIAQLLPANASFPNSIDTSLVETGNGGAIDIAGTQNDEGTLYSLISRYLDVPTWNELFLQDTETAVQCVYRTVPFQAAGSTSFIQPVQNPPDTYQLDASDVFASSLSRSDSNVANFFWTYAPKFDLTQQTTLQGFAQAFDPTTFQTFTYQNSAESLYGIRIMETTSYQGPVVVASQNSGQKKNTIQKDGPNTLQWITDRRRTVLQMNQDNVVFESGFLRIRGNANIRAGQYVELKRGALYARYYVEQVEHSFRPFHSFTTTLIVKRGTGFINRVQQGGSPYLSERTA